MKISRFTARRHFLGDFYARSDSLIFQMLWTCSTLFSSLPFRVKGWQELANHINLSEYVHLLGHCKNPAQMLLLKWGEKPRWTVDSLLFALEEIGCRDAFNFLRAKTDPKYRTCDSWRTWHNFQDLEASFSSHTPLWALLNQLACPPSQPTLRSDQQNGRNNRGNGFTGRRPIPCLHALYPAFTTNHYY